MKIPYGQRWTQRCSHDGISPKEANDGGRTPVPKPLYPDFFSKQKYTSWDMFKHSFNKVLMPHEKKPLLGANPYVPSKEPKFQRTIKYDHFKMNYHGWDK